MENGNLEELNTVDNEILKLSFLSKIKSVLLIDGNEIDNYVNRTMLTLNGITEVVSFINTKDALRHLSDKNVKYQLILIDIYLPIMDGFEFIDKFKDLELNKTHGDICILTASVNPLHRKIAAQRKINYLEKPLTIENLIKSF